MRRKNKKSKIIAFLFAIILIGLGYAYLTANLKITGTTKIGNARFDVHFENARKIYASSNVTFSSNSNSNLSQGIPIIKGENNTELEWHANFNLPGDYYYIKTDIVNSGDIDAELDLEESNIKIKIGDEAEISYSFDDLMYSHNDTVYFSVVQVLPYIQINFHEGQERYLNAGESAEVAIIVGVPEEIVTNNAWEKIRGKDITITVDLKYIQGDNNPPSSNSNSQSNSNSNRELDVRYENPTFIGAGTTTEFPNNINVPTLSNAIIDRELSEHTIEFNTVFNNPGDYYEFSVDVFNETYANIPIDYSKHELSIDNGELVDLGYPDSISNEYADIFEVNLQYVEDGEKIGNGYDFTNEYYIKLKDDISEENLNLIKGKNLHFKFYYIRRLYYEHVHLN